MGKYVMCTGRVFVSFPIFLSQEQSEFIHPLPRPLPAAFHYKQVLGLWHQGHGVTFKPTTEPWSPGGGEPELEVLLI